MSSKLKNIRLSDADEYPNVNGEYIFLQNTNGFPVYQKKTDENLLYIFCKEFQGDYAWFISDRLMNDNHFYYINSENETACPESGNQYIYSAYPLIVTFPLIVTLFLPTNRNNNNKVPGRQALSPYRHISLLRNFRKLWLKTLQYLVVVVLPTYLA